MDQKPSMVNRPNNVFTLSVAHNGMRELAPELGVTDPAISAEQGNLMRDRLANECGQRRTGDVINHSLYDVALTAHSAGHDGLVAPMATAPTALASPTGTAALVLVLVLDLASDQGLIHLYKPDKLLKFGIAQGNPDLGAHQMGGIVRTETHDPVDLQRTDAFLGGQHHVHDPEPVAQGLVGVLEDGPDQNGEAVAILRAFLALPVVLFVRYGKDFIRIATRAADTFRPTVFHQILAAGIFVRELLLELGNGHLMDLLVHGQSLVRGARIAAQNLGVT